MPFGALLAGKAATAYQETSLKWKEMWQRNEQLKEQRRQFDESQKFQANQAKQAYQNQINLEKLRNDYATNQADVQWGRSVFSTALDLARDGYYNNSQIADILTQFNGNKDFQTLAPVFQNLYREGIYSNPDDALKKVESAITVEGATNVTIAQLNMALDALQPLLGDGFKDYKDDVLKAYESAKYKGETIQGLNIDNLRFTNDDLRATTSGKQANTAATEQNTQFQAELQPTAVEQAQANVANTNASTASIEAGTQRQIYALNFLDPKQAQLIDGQIQNLAAQTTEAGIRNTFLPLQLATDLSTSQLDLKQKQETFDTIVQMYKEELYGQQKSNQMTDVQIQQAGSDLRVQLATEGARIAIENKQPELLDAQLANVYQGIDESIQRITSMQASDDMKQQELDLLRQDAELNIMNTLTSMIEAGRTEMLSNFGGDMLRRLGYVKPNEMVGRLVDAASTVADRDALEAEIQIELLTAERDMRRWEVSNADAKFGLEQWIAQENVRLGDENLALGYANLQENARQFNARLSFDQSKATAGSGKALTPKAIYDAIGSNYDDFAKLVTSLNGYSIDMADETLMDGERGAIALAQQDDFNSLVGITRAYMAYSDGELPPILTANPDLTRQVMIAAGFAEAPDPLKGTEPTNTNDSGGFIFNSGLDPQAASQALWQRMSPEEKNKYQNKAGIPDFNVYYKAVQQGVGAAEAEQNKVTQANSDVNKYAITYMNMQPDAGETFSYGKKIEMYDKASSQITTINQDLVKLDSIFSSVQMGTFGPQYSPEQQQAIQNIASRYGFSTGADPQRLLGMLRGRADGLRQLQTAINKSH